MENNNLVLSRVVVWIIGIVSMVLLEVNNILSWADVCSIGITFSVLIFYMESRFAICFTMLAAFFILIGHYFPLVSLHSEVDFELMNRFQSAIGRGINIWLNAFIYLFIAFISLLTFFVLSAIAYDIKFKRLRGR